MIPRRQTNQISRFAFLGAILLTAGLFYWRFGYQYGFSDQDEFLPLVFKWMDASLFERDWFVLSQSSTFSVRTAFAGIIFLLAERIGVNLSVALIHLATGLALIWGLTRISYRLYHNELTTIAFLLMVLVFTPRWNPGGNDIWHAMLVPSTLAWTLMVWSLDRVMARRFLLGGLLAAAAMVVHPLIGLQIGSIIGVVLLWKNRAKAVGFLLPFLAVALPSIVLFSDFSAPDSGRSATYILTTLRAPHHYLPQTFPLSVWFKWLVVVIPGAFYLWTDKGNSTSANARDWVLGIGLLSFFVVLIGILCSTLIPVGAIIKLQPFTLAVWLRVLAALGSAAVLVAMIPRSFQLLLNDFVKRPLFVVICISTLFSISALKTVPELDSQAADARLDTETAQWIRSNTPANAVFAIPPSLSGFQIQTHRAQFVNFKAFPFQDDVAIEWLERLLIVAPVANLEPGGSLLQSRLDQAYFEQIPSRWNSIHRQSNIDYLVRRAHPADEWTEYAEKWCNSLWCVYDLSSQRTDRF